MERREKTEDTRVRTDFVPDMAQMIPYHNHDYLRAEGVPRFGQKEAYILSCLAVDGLKKEITLVDTMCGNGAILMSGGLHFSDRIHHLFGFDLNHNTALIAGMNLDEMRRIRLSEYRGFPKATIVQGNALTCTIPRAGQKTVVVTDIPSKKQGYFDAEGRPTSVDFYLPAFLQHVHDSGIIRVVFSVEDSFDSRNLDSTPYNFSRALTDSGRDFFVGKRKKGSE